MVSNLSYTNKQNKRCKNKEIYFIDYEKEFQNDSTFKTELCLSYTNNGSCKYGNRCRFAHGKKELFDKSLCIPNYKLTECVNFLKLGFCNYGYRCHFKHDDRQFNNLSRSWFMLNLMIKNSNNNINRLDVFKKINNVNFNLRNIELNIYNNNILFEMIDKKYCYYVHSRKMIIDSMGL
jgi:hypothetical protein